MFAILVPASLSPLIITLYWAENKAKKLGLVDEAIRRATPGYVEPVKEQLTITQRIWRFAEQLDLVGLVLLGAAVSLILLPLTLSQTAKSGWKNPSIIAMLVIGVILLFVFAGWDFKFAKKPVVAWRFMRNRSVTAAAWIGFFDFVSLISFCRTNVSNVHSRFHTTLPTPTSCPTSSSSSHGPSSTSTTSPPLRLSL